MRFKRSAAAFSAAHQTLAHVLFVYLVPFAYAEPLGALIAQSGITSSCPGLILSGSISLSLLASKIFMYWLALP
jgi:hypothetical protein